MRLTIDRDTLYNALGPLQKATADMREITKCVLLEANGEELRLSTTDLRLSLTCSLAAEIEQAGACAIEAKQLRKIVATLPKGSVSVAVHDAWALVSSKTARFKLPTVSADDFPTIPRSHSLVEVPTPTLEGMIRRTLFAASNDMSHIYLTGVSWEPGEQGLTLAATDGHRMAMTTRELAGVTAKVIVPKLALSVLLSLLTGETTLLAVDSDRLYARCGAFTLAASLVDAVFPDYRRVIPTGRPAATLTVDRADLIGALKRLLVVSDEETHSVILAVKGEELALTSDSIRTSGSDRLPVTASGTMVPTCFNATYLLELLEAMAPKEVTFELNDALGPCAFRDGDDAWVIMPLRTE